MKCTTILMLASVALTTPIIAHAGQPEPIAGSALIGVTYAELREVTTGWSAKRQVLGQPVFNGKNEKIGSVDDVIIAPDKSVSYGIIGAGGFLGMGKHDVAIPVSQMKLVKGRLVLAGATKDVLMAMPVFEYAH